MHGHILPKRAIIQHERALFRTRGLVFADKARVLVFADKARVLVQVARDDLLHALDFLDASQSVAQGHGRHFLDSREIFVIIRIETAMRNRHFSTPTHL